MKISITCITPVLQAILDFFPDIISFQYVFHLDVGRSQIEWKLKVKTQISVFPWAKIGQNDHSNPYIESTTVLSVSVSIITMYMNAKVQPDFSYYLLQPTSITCILQTNFCHYLLQPTSITCILQTNFCHYFLQPTTIIYMYTTYRPISLITSYNTQGLHMCVLECQTEMLL